MSEVTAKLLREGLASFQKSFESLSAGLEKKVVADFFPAYDDDGGLLVAITPA